VTAFLRAVRFGVLLALGFGGVQSAVAASKDERWLRVSTPEFVVVTSLREKEAVAWAGEFAQYIAALRGYFQSKDRWLAPLTVVVFARERDFERYRPLGADGRAQQVAGFFLRHDSWAVAGLAGATQAEETRHLIFHEGLHWFLSGAEAANPVWIEEGLAEVFATFGVVKGQAEWGRAMPEHVSLLRREGLLPLERLLFTGREELFGRDLSHTGLVYAQSWAFAHYLIFGKHEIPRGALVNYAELTLTAIGPDEAFRRAFGKTYKEMDKELERYLNGGSHYVSRRPLAEFTPPKVAVASRADTEDALARLALGGRRWALAETHARAAIIAAPDDPRGHEVLGFALKQNQDQMGALAAFARAVELGTKDALPFFELASAEHNEAAGGVGDAIALAPDAARRVANRYERAINLNPRFRLAYRNLAGVVGVAEPWSAEDRRFLEFGRKVWPDDAMIQVGLAILTRRAGESAAARTELDRVLATSSGEGADARAYARRLAEGWEQQDIIGELNRLIEAQQFAEAAAFIESNLERGVSSGLRAQLASMLRPIQVNILSKKIERALRDQQWAEARGLLGSLLESAAPVSMKTQARRSLAELDRLRLGLEAARK